MATARVCRAEYQSLRGTPALETIGWTSPFLRRDTLERVVQHDRTAGDRFTTGSRGDRVNVAQDGSIKNIGIMYYRLPVSPDPRSVLYRNVLGLDDDLDDMSEFFEPRQ